MAHSLKNSRLILLKPIFILHMAIILWPLIHSGCSIPNKKEGTGIHRFDAIVESVLERQGFKKPDRFIYKVVEEGQQRHYVVRYLWEPDPAKIDDLAHWIAVISVAKAGTFIDSARYEAIEKAYPAASSPKFAKRYLEADDINISTNYAPRGVFSGMIVTTLDNRYDVKIMASNLLPDDIPPPTFDHDSIGKMILEKYATQSK